MAKEEVINRRVLTASSVTAPAPSPIASHVLLAHLRRDVGVLNRLDLPPRLRLVVGSTHRLWASEPIAHSARGDASDYSIEENSAGLELANKLRRCQCTFLSLIHIYHAK